MNCVAKGFKATIETYGPDAVAFYTGGRIHDQWHSITRAGKSTRLSAHMFEPLLHIHPAVARRHRVKQGQLAQVFSSWGEVVSRIEITEDQRPGSVFLPIHWNNQFASCARTNSLVNPVTDPISEEPEFKRTPVRIAPYQPAWYGFLLTRKPVYSNGIDY